MMLRANSTMLVAALLFLIPALTAQAQIPIDVDLDGVPDIEDNCVETFNPSQIDSNSDGFGNLCDADLDGNLTVNSQDLGLFRSHWVEALAGNGVNPDSDFNSDGVINVLDLAVMRATFNGAPGPISNVWTNSEGGAWNDASNWSRGEMPGRSHAARILIETAAPIQYTAGFPVASLSTNSEMAIVGGTLEVEGAMAIAETVSVGNFRKLEAATLTSYGEAAVVRVPDNTTGQVEIPVVNADVHIGDSSELRVFGDLILQNREIIMNAASGTSRLTGQFPATLIGGMGEIVFSGAAGTHLVSSNSYLEIEEHILLRAESGSATITADRLFLRGDVLSTTTNGDVTLGASECFLIGDVISTGGGDVIVHNSDEVVVAGLYHVENGGNFRIAQAVSTVPGTLFRPESSINVVGGNMVLRGNFTNQGALSVTNGLFDSGNSGNYSWNNSGTIGLVSSDALLGGRFTVDTFFSLDVDGTSTVTGTIVNLDGVLDLGALPGDWQIASGAGIEGGMIVNTPVVVPAGAEFTLNSVVLATDAVVGDGSTLVIDTALTLVGSSVSMNSIDSFSLVRFKGPFQQAVPVDGIGEFVFNGTTSASVGSGILSNCSNPCIDIGPDITIRSGTSGGSAADIRTLHGQLISDVSGGHVSLTAERIYGPILNSDGANISVEWSNDLHGAITSNGEGEVFLDGRYVQESAVIEVNGGSLRFQSSNLVNAGIVRVTDGNFIIFGDQWRNEGLIDLIRTPGQIGGFLYPYSFGTITTDTFLELTGTLINFQSVIDLRAQLPPNTVLGDGGEVFGGTVTGEPVDVLDFATFTLDGVTLASDITVGDGATLRIENSLIMDDANIFLKALGENATLLLVKPTNDTTTLEGQGEIVFSNSTDTGQGVVDIESSGHNVIFGADIVFRSAAPFGAITTAGSQGSASILGSVIAEAPDQTISIAILDLEVGGLLFAGTGATLRFFRDLNLTPTAVVELGIGGDQTLISGRIDGLNNNVALDGELRLRADEAYVPMASDAWLLVESETLSGEFASVVQPDLAPGLSIAIETGNETVSATVVQSPAKGASMTGGTENTTRVSNH